MFGKCGGWERDVRSARIMAVMMGVGVGAGFTR